MARLARDRRGPAIQFQLLICPSTDLGGAHHASRQAYSTGYLTSEEAEIKWSRRHYVPDGIPVSDDRISPLLAVDLSEMPPAIVVTARL